METITHNNLYDNSNQKHMYPPRRTQLHVQSSEGTMAASVMRSPLRFCPMPPEDPYNSPAKRFVSEYCTRSDVKVVTTNATYTRLTQSQDGDMLVPLLQTIPKTADKPMLERYQLYKVVQQVYSAVRHGKAPAENVPFASDAVKRRVYQMVFDVLYHQPAVEDMLVESGFYARHFDLHGHKSLVAIMAYDFQKERFGLKPPTRDSHNTDIVLRVAEALWQHKVKLGAALARMRVKANAKNISQLIPGEARPMYERTLNQPCYARVNTVKVNNVQVEIISQLCRDGFAVVDSRDHLYLYPRSVYSSQRSLLEFSPDCRPLLSEHELVTEGCLVVQDMASYCFVDSIRHCIEDSQGDVILTNCNAGVEAAHIATLIGDRGTVFAFGALPVQMRQLNQRILTLRLDNVQFVQAPFTSVLASDELLNGVGAVVCLPPSSLSAVSHPVDFVLQEGDQHLPALLGNSIKAVSAKTLVEQMEVLIHALTFGQAKYVTYGTRSIHEAENGGVVRRALERHRAVVNKEREGAQSGNTLKCGAHSAIYTLRPSPVEREKGSEYFTAVFERMSEHRGPSANDVIANAIAKGILTGEGISVGKHIKKPKGATKKKCKKVKVFSQYDGIPMTIAAKQKVVKKKPFHESPKKPFI